MEFNAEFQKSNKTHCIISDNRAQTAMIRTYYFLKKHSIHIINIFYVLRK